MAVTTLEAATAFQKPEHRTRSRCAFPLKALGVANAIFASVIVAAIAMPEMVQELLDSAGVPAQALLRSLDLREPAYMAFALVWVVAVIYMHVDEINESRLALRSAAETETIRAYTVEDLVGHFVRAAIILIPSFGLYFLPKYLHNATPAEYAAFVLVFAFQFFVWRRLRNHD